MAARRTPQISSRKQPKQARSAELVATILEAAIQVLEKEGAHRFTTIRVAEKAGVSVGSVYQYFPNKAAILFRLQSDEWQQTSGLLRRILDDTRTPPLRRLRNLVHAFLQSECEEAKMRVALSDAAPLYRNAPEAKKARDFATQSLRAFMHELLPETPAPVQAIAGELITTTLSQVGKHFSQTPRTRREIEKYAEEMADMFCAYIKAKTPRKGSNMPARAKAIPR